MQKITIMDSFNDFTISKQLHYAIEDLGFEKLDILSQRGIGHINDCAKLVLKNKGKEIDVHRVQEFKKDKKVNSYE